MEANSSPDRPRRSQVAAGAARRAVGESRRSHAAIPVAVVVVAVGIVLSRYTLLLPGVLGLGLLVSGFSLLGTRINPLSPHFYLTRKPSWSAIGVVFLSAIVLIGYAYYLWTHHLGAILPHG